MSRNRSSFLSVMAAVMAVLTLGSAAQVRADACPGGNLLASSSVSGIDLPADTRAVADGSLTLSGAPTNAKQAVPLQASTVMTFDLGSERTIRALLLQASAGARYRVEASLDGMFWQTIWQVELADSAGLRGVTTEFERPLEWRYLKFSVARGTKGLAVSELAAFCALPDEWPPERLSEAFLAPPWWSPDGRLGMARAAVAMGAVCLFLYGMLLQRMKRPQTHRRLRDGSLGVLATLSFVLFFNAFQFHHGRFEHLWEFYHHYMGGKYFDELGYARLYDCAAVADVEAGLREDVEKRKYRNLHENLIEGSASILADPGQCTRHFSAARWEGFKKDAAWFRQRMGKHSWEHAQTDHGYNATPVWGIVGATLANQTEASDFSIRMLALLDPLLLLTMWGFVWWAFGWRVLCVAMIWWGTNYSAHYYWNGGSYLRMDWLATAVISICLVRKRKMAAGGVVLACAAGLRVIPVFIVSGLVLKALARMWRERRFSIDKDHLRFALGALAAGVVLLGASSLKFGSINVWAEFAEDSRLHVQTPLTNYVGLPTLLSYDGDTNMRRTTNPKLDDPYATWKEARRKTFADRYPMYLLAVAAFIALLAWRVRDEEDWVAMTLGIGMIPIATEMTCYYYAILLGFGLLWRRGGYAAAAALSALALFTQIIPMVTGYNDEIFSAISLAIVVFVFWITFARPVDASQQEKPPSAVEGA